MSEKEKAVGEMIRVGKCVLGGTRTMLRVKPRRMRQLCIIYSRGEN